MISLYAQPLARLIVLGVLQSFMTFGVLKRLGFAFKMILFPLPVCQGNNSVTIV